jgi:hypothetical protein
MGEGGRSGSHGPSADAALRCPAPTREFVADRKDVVSRSWRGAASGGDGRSRRLRQDEGARTAAAGSGGARVARRGRVRQLGLVGHSAVLEARNVATANAPWPAAPSNDPVPRGSRRHSRQPTRTSAPGRRTPQAPGRPRRRTVTKSRCSQDWPHGTVEPCLPLPCLGTLST